MDHASSFGRRSDRTTYLGRWWICLLLLMFGVYGRLVTEARGEPAKPPVHRPSGQGSGPATKASAVPAPAPDRPPASKANQAGAAPKTAPTAKPGAPTKPKGSAKSRPTGARQAAGQDPRRQTDIFGDRIDGLQTQVDELKDRVFRSRARLALLRETVLKGVMAGSRIVLSHRNLMGSGFRLVRLVFIMDGAQIYARADDSGALDSEDELVVYDGNLPPGPHSVTIEMTYKGNGYGVFSYLTGYTFESRSSHSFTAPENGALKLSSLGFERGNLTTEMGDRPSVRWEEVPLDAAGRPLPQGRSRRPGVKGEE